MVCRAVGFEGGKEGWKGEARTCFEDQSFFLFEFGKDGLLGAFLFGMMGMGNGRV